MNFKFSMLKCLVILYLYTFLIFLFSHKLVLFKNYFTRIKVNCDLSNAFFHVLSSFTNQSWSLTNDGMNLKLNQVSQITGISIYLGSICQKCHYVDIEIRVGYQDSNVQLNKICSQKYLTEIEQKPLIKIECERCSLYGDHINVRLSGYYKHFKIKQLVVFGSKEIAESNQCTNRVKCEKKQVRKDDWKQWIDRNVDLNQTIEHVLAKSLHPWLSLAARKLNKLDHEGFIRPLKIFEEYPLISPLDISSILAQQRCVYCCRVQWNQRYQNDQNQWILKSDFNSSHIQITHIQNLADKHSCPAILQQFEFIFTQIPRHLLPEYMDIIFSHTDYPTMPISDLYSTNEPNNGRSQSLSSFLPQWLTPKNDFRGDIDYFTVNLTIPLLDIPPPMLSYCTTDKHIDISWFYFLLWIHRPVDEILEKLSSKLQAIKDCSSSCDIPSEWHTRRQQATWRGSISAVHPDIKFAGNWQYHKRIQLKQQSIQRPDLLDVHLTYCMYCDNQTRDVLVNSLGRFVETDGIFSFSDYISSYSSYQGLIDIDGATWSARFYQLLAQGAVIFKQQSEYKEWWYDLLIPNVHYIPLAHDMLDTIVKVETILSNENRAQEIAMNAVRFAATYLRTDAFIHYAQMFFRAYSALLIKPWSKLEQLNTTYLFEQAQRIQKENKSF